MRYYLPWYYKLRNVRIDQCSDFLSFQELSVKSSLSEFVVNSRQLLDINAGNPLFSKTAPLLT